MSSLYKHAMQAFKRHLLKGSLNITKEIAGEYNRLTSKFTQPLLVNEIAEKAGVPGNGLRKTLKGAKTPKEFGEKLHALRVKRQGMAEYRHDVNYDRIQGEGGVKLRESVHIPGVHFNNGSEGHVELHWVPSESKFGVLKTHTNDKFLGGRHAQGQALKERHDFLQNARKAGGNDSGFVRSLGYDVQPGQHPKSMTEFIHGRSVDGINTAHNAINNSAKTMEGMGMVEKRLLKANGMQGGTYYRGPSQVVQDLGDHNMLVHKTVGPRGKLVDNAVYFDPLVTKSKTPVEVSSGLPIEDFSDYIK